MILTCPECSTRYKTKSEVIGINGRTVSCKQCSATWFVAAPQDVLSTPDDLQLKDMKAEEAESELQKALDEPQQDLTPDANQVVAPATPKFKPAGKTADAIMRDRVDAAKRRVRMKSILLIWLIPLTLIALLCVGLIMGREAITERFPGTSPFYNAIGIKTSLTGLEIDPPIIRLTRVNGEQTLIINGVVRNISREIQTLPFLDLSLHTEAGDEVARWRVEFDKTRLKSGEQISFASEYPNPPVDVRRLKYRLGDQKTEAEAPISTRPNK